MRRLLVFVSLCCTYLQPTWAKAPDRCADLLRAHVAAQPRFANWMEIWDATEGEGEVTMVIKVDQKKNERNPVTLALPPWRSMKVLEPFTYQDDRHAYYVAIGRAEDWNDYGMDLGRDLGDPKFQLLGEGTLSPNVNLLDEVVMSVLPFDSPFRRLSARLRAKSPTYARFADWTGHRTERLARWLRQRRIPTGRPSADLTERLTACATPFCVFEPLPAKSFDEALRFLKRQNPRFDFAQPGALQRMFVNVLDRLAVESPGDNVAAIAATGVSGDDVANIADEAAQRRVFAAFDIVYRALVTAGYWQLYAPLVNHDAAFLDYVITAYEQTALIQGHTKVPWTMTLDEWITSDFATVYFDKSYAHWTSTTAITLVTNGDRAWAVVTTINLSEGDEIIEALGRLDGYGIAGPALADLTRFEYLAKETPVQFMRDQGLPILDRVMESHSVVRIARPLFDDAIFHGDLVIIPLERRPGS